MTSSAVIQQSLEHETSAFGRLHLGLTSNDQVDWKEPSPKPRPVRRESSTWKRIRQDDKTFVSMAAQNNMTSQNNMASQNNIASQNNMTSTNSSNHVTNHVTNNGMTSSVCNAKRVLESDTNLQLSLKANSILGGSTWTKNLDPNFVKLDSKVVNGDGADGGGEGTMAEQHVFRLTETEKYILKQIMNMTQNRAGLQAHRNLAETHLIRVQTHMEDPLPSEISEGGYVHLPDRTKMKRHYMKKLGRKATKSEVQVPKECCSMRGPDVTYDPVVRRQDIKNVIIPLTPGSLPDTDFRFRHMFVVDMDYMEKHKIDLTNDKVPVFSAAHPNDKYVFSKSVSTDIKERSKRLMAGIRIAFNNRLYWRDVMKGKSKPSAILTEGETDDLYRKECEKFLNNPLTCRSMVYYVDIYDPVQEYDSYSQGYVGVLENSPRLLAANEGMTFRQRLQSHIENDASLFETVLSLSRLWRQNFYDGRAGASGVLDISPSILILPLDFGFFGGATVKTKQTDRLRYLESKYLKYFGGISPVTLNMNNSTG